MYKYVALLLLWVLPVSAQNLDAAIQELTKDVPGQIVTPSTTQELKALFKDATPIRVPRVFVDKLPSDFAQNGSGELYTNVITALILRANEQAIKEKMILAVLRDKYERGEQWSPIEESFFNSLVEKYDETITKTRQTQLDQLGIKVDEVLPGLAVAQSVYATDWGRKNMEHPYGQMGWLDEKTYAEIPYDSLIKATDAYVKEMNTTANYWMWRARRQTSAHRGNLKSLAYTLAGQIRVYRPEDPYYHTTIQKIILNNQPLTELYQATFIDEKEEK